MAEIVLMCDGVGCDFTQTIELAPGWTGVSENLGSNSLFCPECVPQAAWFTALCPGCAGAFPDCELGRQLPHVSDAEIEIIHTGRCPFRSHGYVLDEESITDPQATPESGAAVALGIKKHIQEWESLF